MSVNVRIMQDPAHRRGLDLAFIRQLAAAETLYIGVMNDICCLETFTGEDAHEVWFVLFSRQLYCRGMQLRIDAHDDLELILNLPCGPTDIRGFYRLIMRCAQELGVDSFVQEEETCALADTEALCQTLLRTNRQLILEMQKEQLTIFGCIYPIAPDDSLTQLIEKAGPDQADRAFELYMDHRQKKDCYYARPLLYRDQEGLIHARYALTEGVPTIFPTVPFLPFGYDQELKERIQSWHVSIITKHQDSYREFVSIPFPLFQEMMGRVHRARFDAYHVVLTLNEELLWFVRPYEIEQAVQRLSIWLSDPRELGRKPYSVTHTKTFDSEAGIRCHIFRYKASMFSSWLLGIVSDIGVYSEMNEYHKKSEQTDANALLAILHDFRQKKRSE